MTEEMGQQCSTVDNVSIPKGAFIFCRYAMAVLIWAAYLLKMKELVVVLFVLMLLSAVLTVARAPLVWLYTVTLNRIIPWKNENLSVGGMRVAHTMGAVFSAVCLVFLYKLDEPYGWRLTFIYCVIKTVSAIWACPVYKLYACMKSGNCCTFMKWRK